MNLIKSWGLKGALVALAALTAAWGGGQANTLTAIGDKTACPGDSVTFTTTASGPTPYKFTWYKNGAIISNQTTNHLTLTNVKASDMATYSVVLKGGSNSVTNSGTLTVATSISATPLPNLLRYVGSIAVFTTTPSGGGPYTFTWQKNGTNILGQTGSSLTLSNVTLADTAAYTVIVTGACGNTVTESGSLTVDTCFPAVDVMLVIDRSGSMTGKPYFDALAACSNFVQNLHYTNGDQAGLASYNSAATLDQTLTNNLAKLDKSIAAIPGATGFTSVSLGLQTGQGELVSVRHHSDSLPVLVLLSDGMPTGGDNSSNALYWATQSKIAGTRIFTVGLGSVNASLLKGIASTTNDYYFTTNSSELKGLFNAISTVICRPPTNIVVMGPSNLTVCAGGTANFSATAAGCDAFRYQWYKGTAILSGKTNNVLTLSNVSAADAGAYSVAVLSDCQNVTNSATLTVNAGTVVTVPPSNATNCPGTTANFSVNATGTGLTYQWYKGTSLISGQAGNTLTLGNISAADAGVYSVVVSGTCSNPVTNSATLVVNSSVVVVTPPANTTVCAGTPANFSVNATGTGLTYQWYKGTSLLGGKTGSTLTLNGVTAGDAAIYSVVVTGICGVPVTNSASLFVNANTIITMAPTNTTVCPGMTANFSVNATGTGLTYQWFKGTSVLGGKTGSTLTLPSVAAADAGVYSVMISGACSSPVTNSATLFVNANAIVTVPPMNSTNCPGTTANFSVNATGTGLSYQWYHGAGLLSGQTNSTLSLLNVSAPADLGSYSVVVSGACGLPVTNSATLLINSNTIVATPPNDVTVCPGMTANFAVVALGTDFTFQWYNSAGPLSGQTGSTLSLTNVSAANAGTYSVVVSGICGMPITNSATLVVNTNTLIATPPSNATNCPGTTANFSVNAVGTGLTYQWYKGVTVLSGHTTNILTLSNVSAANAGVYSVVISGACGLPVTNSASLFVNANTIVTVPPMNSTNCPGTTANFSVNGTGTGLSYQWYNSAGPLSGQTNSTLSLLNVSAPADLGSYSVVVSGACGLPVTNSATLFVNSNTVVLLPPSDVTVCPGMTANFTVGVTGTDFTFQWYNSAGPLNGQTGSTLSLANVSAANAGVYRVVVKGVCGVPATNSATLFVNANTIIATPPSNTTNCPGTTANFSVNASGTGLTYQWYKSTGPINGQTNSTLSLPNVSAANAGVYSVVISGACGLPVTNSASLFVNANTIVTVPPTNTTNCPGTTANFSVNATGTGLSYQWYHGAGPLHDQTNSTLSLLNVKAPPDLGIYSVVVSGACGLPVTNSATLFVNSNTVVVLPPQDVTVCPGMTANFNVSATGTDVTFQWYNSAGPLNGQTSSTLSLTNVSAADAGVYRVVVSGICGVPITNSATLAVNTNALIATPPSNATNCPGTMANFSVNAVGTGLTYQWYKGATLLADHTTNVLTLNNVSAVDAGVYRVVISGVCGVPVTNSATLVINTNALIATPLSNATNCPGTTANFSVNAIGTGLTYQWYKGTALLLGHTTNVLTLNNVSAADAGTYSVVVSGVCGTPVTNSATLFVNENTVLVYSASTNETVCPGMTVNFFDYATGTDLAYQWYKGTTPLAGQTADFLTLTNVSASDAGTYELVVSGACGTPVTNSATLFVNANTIITVPPTNTTVCPGMTANFSVNATGTGLTYQWYNAAGTLDGQTGSTLTLPTVSVTTAGTYTVVVSGTCGMPVTNSAVLTVNQNVSVAALANVTNNIGSSVTFTAVASGTGPFSYQWFKGAAALTGQTNSTLTLSNLQPQDGGMYSVSVSGACGQAAATATVLTINLPPTAVITYPTNGSIFVEPATFTVLAAASDPDGVVTNVEIFSSTNGTNFVLLGQTNDPPYLTIASNLAAGHYTFVARATDNWGATGDSAPVSVDVVPVNPPDVFTVGAITLNTQDGFQWLTNVACNPVYSHANALRIDIHNITNSAIRVVNASGTNNGVPFVISPGAIQPGTCWTNVIKFYDPLDVAFFPILTVQLADPIGVGEPDGTPQAIFSGKFLRDGTFLVEFTTVPGITYYVQYSSDMVHWKTVFPPFAGTGQHLQWIDSGPPETESLPSTKTARFYRVLLAN